MSIDRRPDGKYRARWREAAGRQRSKHFDRKRDAIDYLATVVHTTNRGAYVAPDTGRERFKDYAVRWAETQDWKASTREAFEAHLRRVLPELGGLRLDKVDELVLKRLRTVLTERYATSTATISLHYACAVMRSAARTGRIARDPTTDVSPPKRRDGDVDGVVGPDQVPIRDEVTALIAGAPERFRAAVVLGAYRLRIGEVLGATDDRLALDAGTLRIDRQLQQQRGDLVLTAPKREKKRTIDLPGWARLELRRHLRDHGPFTPLSAARAGCCSGAVGTPRCDGTPSTTRRGTRRSRRRASAPTAPTATCSAACATGAPAPCSPRAPRSPPSPAT